MAELDAENAALESKIAALEAQLGTSAPVAETSVTTETPWYAPQQLAYDVTTGALKGFTGLADLITTPGVAIARAGGIDMPYFGISKMVESDLQSLAPQAGLKEGSTAQEIASYVTPTGPGKLAKQAGTGLAAYLGAKTGETIAPESPYAELAGALIAPSLVAGAAKAGTKLKDVGVKLAYVPPSLDEQTSNLVKNIDTDVAKLTTQAIEEPSRTIRSAGENQAANIVTAKTDLKKAVTEAFKDPEVYNATVNTTGLRDDISTIVQDWSGGRKTQIADQELAKSIDELTKLEKPKLGQALSAFTTPLPNEAPLGKLHELQIKIGRSLPSGSPESFTPDQALAYRIYEYIGNVIDNTPGSEKLVNAKQLSKSYRDAFVWDPTLKTRAPLATAQRREPEKLIQYLTGGSTRFDSLQKANVDITPLQNQLTNDFIALKTPEAKVAWINKNRPVFQYAPFWSTFEDAGTKLETQLAKVEPLKNQPTILGQALGRVALKGLSSVPGLGMLPLAVALSKQYGKTGIGNLIQMAATPFSKAPVVSLPELLSRGIVAAVETDSPKIVATSTQNVQNNNETSIPQYINARDEEFKIEQDVLNKFVDPDKLKTEGMDKYDLIKDETKLNKVIDEETKRKRDAGIGTLYTQEGKAPVFVLSGDRTPKELLATDQGIKIQPGVKLKDGISTPELPAAKSTSLEDENIALEAKIAAYKKQFGIKNETATTAGKQEISAIIDDVATKYKVPASELKAIAQIESSFNPKAVGPKTRFGQAKGAMQLMPATAEALEVKDPFDPRQSIEGASKLLLELENTFGKYNDRRFIWAAYNSRPALVKNAIRKVKADGDKVTWGNVSKYMPPETKDYVRNISNLV